MKIFKYNKRLDLISVSTFLRRNICEFNISLLFMQSIAQHIIC